MRKHLIYFLIGLISIVGYSQGLNNQQQIDSVDIKNSFSLLGIEIFKFPVNTKEEYNINYIIEEYKNGILKREINYLNLLKKKKLPGYVLNSLLVKSNFNKWFRIYFKTEDDKKNIQLLLQLGDNLKNKLDFSFDEEKYGTRAFAVLDNKIVNKKAPLAIWYAKNNVKAIEHCPGDKTVEEISLLYDHIIVVYIELIKP